MAFEGINTAGLRSALNNCKNQLNYNYSNQLIGTLSGNDWISDSKNNLKGAVERLINVKYNNLISQIDRYLNVTSMIEKYKSLQADNSSMEYRITQLEPNLYDWVPYDYYYTDENGEEQVTTRYYQEINWSVKNEINILRNNINSNNNEMELLKANINSSI